ncbi:MAG: GAF domain-containing protein [Steroidobacteraceae bacterium]|jgi:GAF domain-containing protein|nr:GAF domain-containing protein [Steroidobacteraceae bacterium]
MGSVVPLHPYAAHAEADRLALAAPLATVFRAGALGAQARLLTLLGSDAPLPVLLDALARYVETWAPSVMCSILLRDPERNVLVSAAAPSLPREYVALIGEVPIGEDCGSCGTAAWRREPVTVYDIATSSLWSGHRHLALPHGLRACWSVPVLEDSGEVLGTLALYCHEPHAPSDAERELITFAAALAKMVVLQHRRLAALWESNERLTLERAAIEAAECEREKLALDLHDGVGQQLVGIEWLLASEAVQATGPQAEALRSLRELVAGVQRDVRALSTWMLPLARRTGRFGDALQELAREAGRQHGLPVRSSVRLRAEPAMDEETRASVLRILQGALHYALSQPDCRGAGLSLDDVPSGLALEVRIECEALGEGAATPLRAIRYRAMQIGAALSFGSPAPGISAMRLTIPPRAPAPG